MKESVAKEKPTRKENVVKVNAVKPKAKCGGDKAADEGKCGGEES